MADLQYTIGADASNFNANVKGLAQTASDASNQVSASLAAASQSVDNLGGRAQSASMQFIQMRSGLSAMRDGTLAFAVGGQRADMMLMAMGHHITSLVNETGSLRGALASMTSSMMGVGGAILAVTILFEIFQKTSKKSKEATEDYISTLDSVRQATLKGKQDGQSEIIRLGELYRATQDHKLSLIERNLAYDELARKYPQFFTNADREKTLLGENATAYNKLATAIMQAAMAKAYEAKIGENSNRIFEDQQKGTDLLTEQVRLQKEVAQAKKNIGESNKYAGGNGAASNTFDPAVLARATSELEKNKQAVRDLNTDIGKLNDANSKMATLAENAEKGAGFKTAPEDSKGIPKIKAAKNLLVELEEQLRKLQSEEDNAIVKGHVPDFWNPTIVEKQIQQIQAKIDKIKELNSEIGKVPENKTTEHSAQHVMDAPATAGEDNFGGHDSIVDGMKKQAQALADLITFRAKSAKSQKEYNAELKEEKAIGQDLMKTFGVGLENAFQSALNGTQSFIAAMKSFLVQLIEKLVAAAAAALALSLILGIATGGASTIGSSLGMSSSFSSLFTSMAGMGKHADGGIFTQPHVGMFGEAGPEAIVTPKHLQEFAGVSGNNGGGYKDGQIVGVLRGQDILLQHTRAKKMNGRIS